MGNIIDYLSKFNDGSILLRLFLATLLGGLIGLERGTKKRPAGLRTFVLVCVGSAMIMITNEYLFLHYGIGDVTRMSAQVVSGIGFLGAGTIIVTRRNQVKGLTTAASLWACAAMGIAIGAGFYSVAIYGFFFIFFAVSILHKMDAYFNSKSKLIDLYLEIKDIAYINTFVSSIQKMGYTLSSFEVSKSKTLTDGSTSMMIELNLGKCIKHEEVIAKISSLDGITYVEEFH